MDKRRQITGLDVENEAGRGVGGDNWVLDLGDFLPFTEREKYRRPMLRSWQEEERWQIPSGIS